MLKRNIDWVYVAYITFMATGFAVVRLRIFPPQIGMPIVGIMLAVCAIYIVWLLHGIVVSRRQKKIMRFLVAREPRGATADEISVACRIVRAEGPLLKMMQQGLVGATYAGPVQLPAMDTRARIFKLCESSPGPIIGVAPAVMPHILHVGPVPPLVYRLTRKGIAAIARPGPPSPVD